VKVKSNEEEKKEDQDQEGARNKRRAKEKKKEEDARLLSLKRIDVHLSVPVDAMDEMHALAGDSSTIKDCINLNVAGDDTIQEMPPLPEGMYSAGPVIELRPQQGRMINIGQPLVLTLPHVLSMLSETELHAYAAYLNQQIIKKAEMKQLEDTQKRKRQALIFFGKKHIADKKKAAFNFVQMVQRAQMTEKREKLQIKRRKSIADMQLRKESNASAADSTENEETEPNWREDSKASKSPSTPTKKLRRKSRLGKNMDSSPRSPRGSFSKQRKNSKGPPTAAKRKVGARRRSGLKNEHAISKAKEKGSPSPTDAKEKGSPSPTDAVSEYLRGAYDSAVSLHIGKQKAAANGATRAVDTTGDGIADTVDPSLRLVDTTGDGIADTIGVALDTTGDGVVDAVAVDTNGDGVMDTVVLGDEKGERHEDDVWAGATAVAPSKSAASEATAKSPPKVHGSERARQNRHTFHSTLHQGVDEEHARLHADCVAVKQAIEQLGGGGFGSVLTNGGVLTMPGGGRFARWQHLRVLKLKHGSWHLEALVDAQPVDGAIVVPVKDWGTYQVVSNISSSPSIPVLGSQRVHIYAFISSLTQPRTGGRVEVRFWVAPDTKAAHAEVTRRERKKRAEDGYWAGFIQIGEATVDIRPHDRIEIKQGKSREEQQQEKEEKRREEELRRQREERKGSGGRRWSKRHEVVMPKSGEKHFSDGKMSMLRGDSTETGIEWLGKIRYITRKVIIPVHTPREFRPEVNIFKWSERDQDMASAPAAAASEEDGEGDPLALGTDPVDVWMTTKTTQPVPAHEVDQAAGGGKMAGILRRLSVGMKHKSKHGGFHPDGSGASTEGGGADVLKLDEERGRKDSKVVLHVQGQMQDHALRQREEPASRMTDGFTLRIPVENGLAQKFRNAGKAHGKHLQALLAIADLANMEKPAEDEEGGEEEEEEEEDAERVAAQAMIEMIHAQAEEEKLKRHAHAYKLKKVQSRRDPLHGLNHHRGHEEHHALGVHHHHHNEMQSNTQ
jgi:hypothetical protein